MGYGGNHRPFWQDNPDPAKRLPWNLRPGVPPYAHDFHRIQTVCPHCGKVLFLDTLAKAKHTLKHFNNCEKYGVEMDEKELVEVVEKRYSRVDVPPRMLLNQLGGIKMTYEEHIGNLVRIALDDSHKSQAIAMTLLHKHFEAEQARQQLIVDETLSSKQIVFNEIKKVVEKDDDITDIDPN